MNLNRSLIMPMLEPGPYGSFQNTLIHLIYHRLYQTQTQNFLQSCTDNYWFLLIYGSLKNILNQGLNTNQKKFTEYKPASFGPHSGPNISQSKVENIWFLKLQNSERP